MQPHRPPRMIWLGLRSHIGTHRMRAHAFLEIVMPPEYLASQNCDDLAQRLHPIFGHHLADTPPIVMPQLRALGRFNATARLSEFAGIPTLVLSAAHDVIFPPASGRALAARIPSARYIEIPIAGHGVTIQLAETVNEILREHFDVRHEQNR
jgi:pimeloyl-ACP methyl ester carboxylesterase